MIWFSLFLIALIIGLICALCIYRSKYKTMKSYYEYSANKAENVTDMIKRNSGSDFTLVAFSIKNIGKINQLFGPTEGDKAVYFTAQELKRTPFWSKYVYAQIYSNLFCFFLEGVSTGGKNAVKPFDIGLIIKWNLFQLL